MLSNPTVNRGQLDSAVQHRPIRPRENSLLEQKQKTGSSFRRVTSVYCASYGVAGSQTNYNLRNTRVQILKIKINKFEFWQQRR